MREWTERHIRELIKNELKKSGGGGGGGGSGYPGVSPPFISTRICPTSKSADGVVGIDPPTMILNGIDAKYLKVVDDDVNTEGNSWNCTISVVLDLQKNEDLQMLSPIQEIYANVCQCIVGTDNILVQDPRIKRIYTNNLSSDVDVMLTPNRVRIASDVPIDVGGEDMYWFIDTYPSTHGTIRMKCSIPFMLNESTKEYRSFLTGITFNELDLFCNDIHLGPLGEYGLESRYQIHGNVHVWQTNSSTIQYPYKYPTVEEKNLPCRVLLNTTDWSTPQ